MAERVVETERLRLRCLRSSDWKFILRLLNEPSFIENIGDKGVRTREAAVDYLESGPIKSYAEHGFGLWCVELLGAGSPIGICGLIKRETLEYVDLGYAFLPQYWRQGYAIEAARAVIELARETFGLSHLAAIVSAGNARSITLLRRLGFEWERTVPEHDDIPLYLLPID